MRKKKFDLFGDKKTEPFDTHSDDKTLSGKSSCRYPPQVYATTSAVSHTSFLPLIER